MTKPSLTIQELNRFRATLESRVAELERGIQRRDGIAVEQTPDQIDEIQRTFEVYLEISNIDRESRELRNARAALRRISEGTFGVCEECEEHISPRRLAAIPWASLCIVCQEAVDCYREDIQSPPDNLVSNAA